MTEIHSQDDRLYDRIESLATTFGEVSRVLYKTLGTVETIKEDREQDREAIKQLVNSNKELSLSLTKGLQEVQLANIERMSQLEKEWRDNLVLHVRESQQKYGDLERKTTQDIEKLSTTFQFLAKQQVECPARIQYTGKTLFRKNAGVVLSLIISLFVLAVYVKSFFSIKG